MPSSKPLPTITDHLKAARGALTSQRDVFGDVRPGSLYDHATGPTAVLLSREASRDRDLFADTYFSNASSDALTGLIQGRYGIARILDAPGLGTSRFARTSAAAGGGKLLRGTRVAVSGSPPMVYQIAQDTTVLAADVVADVPIKSTVVGVGSAVKAYGGLQLLDPTYDPLWLPITLECGDGTNFEEASVYRARALTTRLNARNGYVTQMTSVCSAQGATNVVIFVSSFGLATDDFVDDYGINALYVADNNIQTAASLITNCRVALESARVLGADLWVGGIAQSPLYLTAVVSLIDSPGKLNTVSIARACITALLGQFAGPGAGYTYKLDSLSASIVSADPTVQQVVLWVQPTTDSQPINPAKFPATLTRYTLSPQNIFLTFQGPN
jgi:hypothetical protein